MFQIKYKLVAALGIVGCDFYFTPTDTYNIFKKSARIPSIEMFFKLLSLQQYLNNIKRE